MRHEQIKLKDSYAKVDIPAAWPAGTQVAPLPVPEAEEPFRSAPAVPDVPVAVGKLIVVAYAGLIGAFALATAGSRESWFAITIAALFLVAFFTVPLLILAQEPKCGKRPSFDRFMAEGLETMTGHSSGKAALVQILVVPVSLTLGILAMGIAAAIIM